MIKTGILVRAVRRIQQQGRLLAGALLLAVSLAGTLLPGSLWAAPFAKNIHFTQPDNTAITLWGEGDEFRATFETTTGYTVIFDPGQKAYYYAERSADGKSLKSTGVAAHHPVPQGLSRHIRMDADAVAASARVRQAEWDATTGLSKRWKQLKSTTLGTPLSSGVDDVAPAPPGTTTTGSKVGLTLLIDFSDDPATISQTEIESFLNGDSYSGYGNNGSVKKYFSDVSGGRLTYTNVVTFYVRMTQPKSYYNNTSLDCGAQGRLLIADAMAILKARPDYTSSILPAFNSLTADASGYVSALNVFYAGDNGGVWMYGLWPHSWGLASAIPLGNGKSLYRYQITNVGTELALGTFCHENGHMLCGFPDLYDYQYDSKGGAGVFSLMGSGGHGTNPNQVDAYLKLAAGWATTTEITSSSVVQGTLVAAPNSGYDNFYRFKRPGVATEYFLLENRNQSGRDASLPSSGIAVWHVDELGDRDNQSMTPNPDHLNYELTLVQADNLWNFETNTNAGDATDLYFQGNGAAAYTNNLNDGSSPHAHWWDGTSSGMNLNSFTAPAMSMLFSTGVGLSVTASPLVVSTVAGGSGTTTITTAVSGSFSSGVTLSATGLPSGASASFAPATIASPGAGSSTLTLSASVATPAGEYAINVTATGGGQAHSTTVTFRVTSAGEVTLLDDGFEGSGWATTPVVGTDGAWSLVSTGTYPVVAPHGGSKLAAFNSWTCAPGSQARLYRTSSIAIPANATSATLTFWIYHDQEWSNDDRVQAQISTNGTTWTNVGALIYRYNSTTGWAQVGIDLTSYKGQATVYLGFLGIGAYGNDLHLDDVVVVADVPPVTYPLTLSFAGTGGGSVSGGVSCTSGSACAPVAFNVNTSVTLIPLANNVSSFTGWSGACTNPSGNCTLTMDSAKNVTATFTSAPKVKVAAKVFSTLQSAYNDAATTNGSVIKLLEGGLTENVICGRSIGVILDAGYNGTYGGISGETTIDGSLKLRSGTVRVKRVNVK